jgi:hypothetical protein
MTSIINNILNLIMGNNNSINNKINFEDIQIHLHDNNYLIINTLNTFKQECLIEGTLQSNEEEFKINELIKKNKDINIIIYGENCNDDNVDKKYNQLLSLGFTNIYIYKGGLFEWLLLQDIYGKDEFPTTKEELDLLKYKPGKIIGRKLLTY